MSYLINHYNGTPLVNVPDATLNTTATSIKLPGRNYPSYGLPVADDLVWILENFAGAGAPQNPLIGQLWYDMNSNIVRVWDGSQWSGTGKTIVDSNQPSATVSGQLWYDPSRQQVFISDTTLPTGWKLIGPIGAANGNDGTPSVPNFTVIDTTIISDNVGGQHNAQRMVVAGNIIAIVSSDPKYTPAPSITGFSSIFPGINLNTNISGIVFNGTATNAITATTATSITGINTANFMLNNQTNSPSGGNWDLGTSGNKWGTIYASTFNGVATSAQYSDLAERYEIDKPIQSGYLVMIGGDKEITLASGRGNSDVFGIVSTNPGLMMNSDAGTDDTHPYIAFSGRVPLMVKGIVKKGDRLMCSDVDGVAEVWSNDYSILSIIGRSLQDKSIDGIEQIEVVVGTK